MFRDLGNGNPDAKRPELQYVAIGEGTEVVATKKVTDSLYAELRQMLLQPKLFQEFSKLVHVANGRQKHRSIPSSWPRLGTVHTIHTFFRRVFVLCRAVLVVLRLRPGRAPKRLTRRVRAPKPNLDQTGQAHAIRLSVRRA